MEVHIRWVPKKCHVLEIERLMFLLVVDPTKLCDTNQHKKHLEIVIRDIQKPQLCSKSCMKPFISVLKLKYKSCFFLVLQNFKKCQTMMSKRKWSEHSSTRVLARVFAANVAARFRGFLKGGELKH